MERIFAFLKKVFPFYELDDTSLIKISRSANFVEYKKETPIFIEYEEIKDFLFLIYLGLVEISVSRGERKILLGYRGEGEILGEDILFGRDKYSYSAVCVENTYVIAIPKDVILEIVSTDAIFLNHVAELIGRRVKVILRELDRRIKEEIVPPFLTKRIKDIFSYSKPVFVSINTPIRELAQKMDKYGVDFLLVEDKGKIVGIVTERDLVVKYLSRSVGEKTSDIMNSVLVCVDIDDYCYKALREMVTRGMRHVIVKDEGRIVGVMSIKDFVQKEALSYVNLLQGIVNSRSLKELKLLFNEKVKLVSLLLDSNLSSREICELVTHINDEIVKKVIEIVVDEFNYDIPNFCFLVLGSHGRREQTIVTDQDNAMIYETCTQEMEEIYAKVGEKIVEYLVRVGFEKCKAGVMASNPMWRMSRKKWIDVLYDLFKNPVPEKILRFSIIFDNRILYGDPSLEAEFYGIFREGLKTHPGFVAHMGKEIQLKKPPIGLFGNLIVEKSGEHKNEIDIKLRGLLPICEAVRLLSVIHEIRKVNTFDRIEELKNKGAIDSALADDVVFAYDFLLKLRMRKMLESINKGGKPDNFINPERLTTTEKNMLKESFAIVYRIQREAYKQSGAMFIY
ncbi:MAG: putative nucleotidyltransferase substrate binding domain-containing protein [Thermosulfidibacteraceae bacterium]